MIECNDDALARSEWLEAMRDLSICCADDEAYQSHDRIREMNALLRMAPDAVMIAGLQAIRPMRLQALLDVDACENAVIAMLEHGPGFLVSRSGDGQSLATIALPGRSLENSASGKTPALALIGALALALCQEQSAIQLAHRCTRVEARPALH
jgi:hypothetical protein